MHSFNIATDVVPNGLKKQNENFEVTSDFR